MTTIDEVTMELFEGIKTAQREGNLLGYVNSLAKRLATREDAVRMPLFPPGRPQSDRAIHRPMPTPVREQAMDTVRVANL